MSIWRGIFSQLAATILFLHLYAARSYHFQFTHFTGFLTHFTQITSKFPPLNVFDFRCVVKWNLKFFKYHKTDSLIAIALLSCLIVHLQLESVSIYFLLVLSFYMLCKATVLCFYINDIFEIICWPLACLLGISCIVVLW